MTEMRYPLRALWASYARAAIGVGMMAGMLISAQPGATVTVVLLGLAAVFLVYGLRTALRHATRHGFDERGVFAIGPVSRAIEWGDVVSVKLGYYTTKRDGTSGWWQLDIKGRKSTMRIDSTLDGFAALAERAVREARSRGIELSPTTIENLGPLGIEYGDDGP
jgi:hypothetical protein